MSTIAIVDDDITVSENLKQKLSEAGYQCTAVSKGVRAFEMLKEARPDLIMVDLMMSEVSGFRLCRMIRRDPLLYTVPVIVLSVAEDEPEVLHCMEQGADDFLVKPIGPQELMRKVNGLLLSRETVVKRDPLTGMLGMEAVKREINHKLARGEAIATCYIEAANVRELARAGTGNTGVRLDELVRDLAQLVREVKEEQQVYEVFAGYVGAAHFVLILNLDEYERFCKRLVDKFDSEYVPRWQQDVPRAYLNPPNSARRDPAGRPAPKLSIGVAHTQFRKYSSADKMFQVLAEVQRKALESPSSSYFVDRRRMDR